MKKSFNTHLVLIGLSSVIALTACERRERPAARAKASTLNTNTQASPTPSNVPSTTPSTTPSNTPSNTPSDTPSPVASPLTEEGFMSARESVAKADEMMKQAGYEILISTDAEGLPLRELSKPSLEAVREKLTNAEGSNRDLAEKKMNCDLSGFGKIHADFSSLVETRGTEAAIADTAKSEVAISKAIVKAVEDALHHLGISDLTCESAPSPSASPADAE